MCIYFNFKTPIVDLIYSNSVLYVFLDLIIIIIIILFLVLHIYICINTQVVFIQIKKHAI